ncbi:MAG: glycoside hydrolase family 3 N-terminal domain-containing protein, partial [Terracidiphilus sp.]
MLVSVFTANSRFRSALACAALSACFTLSAAPQTARPHAAQLAHPSNVQLADPAIEVRVNHLLRQMTLEEKIGQLVQYNDTGNAATFLAPTSGQPAPPGANNPGLVALNPDTGNHVNVRQLIVEGRLGSMLNTIGAQHSDAFQHLAVDKSRLHIPLLFGADVIHGFRTVYPVPLAVAASFDPDLAAALSRMSAEESVTAGIRWVYSPMVDISRDPRWGRTVEGAGEDPYLGAAMARACVKGYQGDDLTKPGSVLVAVKHFAAYGAAEAGREYNTADISPITLRQIYLPPYHAAVEAGAATIMSAFNSLNGVPSSA